MRPVLEWARLRLAICLCERAARQACRIEKLPAIAHARHRVRHNLLGPALSKLRSCRPTSCPGGIDDGSPNIAFRWLKPKIP